MTRYIHKDIHAIEVVSSVEELANQAALNIINVVKKHPDAAISLATGHTMIPVYHALAKLAAKNHIDFSRVHVFQLDEYWPASPGDAYSFVRYIREYIVTPLSIRHVYEIDGTVSDPHKEAERYNRLLSRHSIQLALLGIGPWSEATSSGGHIAFNEPGSLIDSKTRVITLDESTKQRDMKRSSQTVSHQAITQGIDNILSASRILLLAYGREKGIALGHALYDAPSPQCPASFLRRVGDNVTIVIDTPCAKELRRYLKE